MRAAKCTQIVARIKPDRVSRKCHRFVANDEVNWRRFFDINELAALRVEDEDVFDAVHEKSFALFGEGLIDGFRVDHVDGLTDPAGYCRRLRARLVELASRWQHGADCTAYKV